MTRILLKSKIKVWKGIRNPRFKPIYKNVDSKGRVLTYIVRHNGFTTEHNSLGEARNMAILI